MSSNRSAPSQPGTSRQRKSRSGAALPAADVLTAVLDLNPDGLLAFDPSGHISHVTAAFVQLTGLRATELLGMNEDMFWQRVTDLCRPDQAQDSVASLRQYLTEPDSQRRNVLELVQPQHRLLRVFERHNAAASVRVLCFRDVTRELDIDRRKSEFLSTAAHELRAPLACIYGFSESLLNQACDAAMQKEFVGIIHQQSHAMAVLLDEMLDLARIEARRQSDLVFEQVPVRQLVQDVLRGFRPLHAREAPVLRAGDADLHTRVDRLKAQQVLLNVLSNAYKYSPAGGSVDISIEAAPAGTAAHPEVLIRIQDHGIGMSTAQLSRAFERYYRAHSVPDAKGAGLGLSISREIMQLMNGRIEIDSAVGAGTCVSLYFPRT